MDSYRDILIVLLTNFYEWFKASPLIFMVRFVEWKNILYHCFDMTAENVMLKQSLVGWYHDECVVS